MVFTDGLFETRDATGKHLGIDVLADVARVAMCVDLFEMADQILDQLAQRQQWPVTDDRTLIVAEIK